MLLFVNDRFGPEAAGSFSPDGQRRRAAERAAELGWPSIEAEEWRYSAITELTLDDLQPALAPPAPGVAAPPVAAGDGVAATVTLIDGWVVDVSVEPGWAAKGIQIEAAAPSTDEAMVEAVTGEQTVFDLLHLAFCPGTLTIKIPVGLSVREPIIIDNRHQGEATASFSHLVVDASEGSDVTIVERQQSGTGHGLSVPIVDLTVANAARVSYQTIQELGLAHWQLGRQRSSVASQATLNSGLAAFGAHYARARFDSRLIGRGASASLATAYYGDGDQIHDFRLFQHHDACDTRSDLLFKGAQDASSGSIYTGLIHIHPDGAGSNAFQTNRNIKLGPDAWAWSVPNLEIENNDVHCSHASTVSPVDEDQQFYLGARGVPPVAADRLIVAGFFDEVIQRMPAGTRDEVRALVAAKLDRRSAS
ncbi:MAG: SufD family Fe-S cluster assembly protein [Actinomycetia bacterium]|nr:SufD family Fe-S cluster assembly protein [Actinomycetes bacterium]